MTQVHVKKEIIEQFLRLTCNCELLRNSKSYRLVQVIIVIGGLNVAMGSPFIHNRQTGESWLTEKSIPGREVYSAYPAREVS